ncbi:cell division protein FtsL [Actinacidiphila acidipaludis]|uniref:Cell division protein FtsL n=1 Tax=Actinacidiphila acidipaludis TaxID=2873382 RepID=A0ABS7Q3E2_9ACTN|nr:cell division protein FtsL [Streptomyces acidipaludis]MBY8876572.1 cell division protein FtsL [Streptomyces acidipaludis]
MIGAQAVRRRSPGGAGATAARTPFVVLIVTLLAGGLISLLLLNSAVNQDSFELNKLQKETTGYTDEQQELQQEVDGLSAPGALEQRARQLGMVPGGAPAFLAPTGTVHGSPEPATAPPAPPSPTVTPAATPTGAAAPGDSPASGGPFTSPTPSTGTPTPALGR